MVDVDVCLTPDSEDLSHIGINMHSIFEGVVTVVGAAGKIWQDNEMKPSDMELGEGNHVTYGKLSS